MTPLTDPKRNYAITLGVLSSTFPKLINSSASTWTTDPPRRPLHRGRRGVCDIGLRGLLQSKLTQAHLDRELFQKPDSLRLENGSLGTVCSGVESPSPAGLDETGVKDSGDFSHTELTETR